MTGIDYDTLGPLMSAMPYCRALGIEIRAVGPGWAEATVAWRDDLVGDPATGVLHGGVVSALMDTACGSAVAGHPAAGIGTATLDLRIDYLRAATPGRRLTARADCVRVTRSIAFVRATAHDGEGETPVATASGAFTVPGAGA